MKNIKKVLAGLLAVALMVSTLGLGTVNADATLDNGKEWITLYGRLEFYKDGKLIKGSEVWPGIGSVEPGNRDGMTIPPNEPIEGITVNYEGDYVPVEYTVEYGDGEIQTFKIDQSLVMGTSEGIKNRYLELPLIPVKDVDMEVRIKVVKPGEPGYPTNAPVEEAETPEVEVPELPVEPTPNETMPLEPIQDIAKPVEKEEDTHAELTLEDRKKDSLNHLDAFNITGEDRERFIEKINAATSAEELFKINDEIFALSDQNENKPTETEKPVETPKPEEQEAERPVEAPTETPKVEEQPTEAPKVPAETKEEKPKETPKAEETKDGTKEETKSSHNNPQTSDIALAGSLITSILAMGAGVVIKKKKDELK